MLEVRGRQEEHPDPEQVALAQTSEPEALDFAAHQLARDLGEHATPVAALSVGGNRASVAQVGDCLDSFGDNIVPGLATDASNEADAAGVVLEPRVVQPACPRE